MPESVLIVGAGPTGLTAALELSRFGVPVRLVDQRAAPADTSRAIGVQARTLELLDRRGLAEELIRAGNAARGGTIYGDRGQVILRPDFGGIDSPFPMILFVSQVETERVLRAAVARQGVEIEWGIALAGVAQDARSREPEPVAATLRHADGRIEFARAAYLISAEGAHSLVRNTLNVPFEGETFAEAYALGDLHYDGDLPADEMSVFAADRGFLAAFPLGLGHVRLMVDRPPGDPNRGSPPTLAEFQAVYDERAHIPARLRDLIWGSWFRINSRMVEHLRAGRFLLGGDSAHIHSPAGGQGMNTGIQDMINLGWKLALVLRRRAPEALLDTYNADRLPVIRSLLRTTEGMTHAIESENPIVRGLRNHLGPWIGATGLVAHRAAARISQTTLGYRASPLSRHWGAGGDLHAGDRLPDLAAHDRPADPAPPTSLHARLDPSRFLLLAPRAADADLAAARRAVEPWADLVPVAPLHPPADPAAAARFDAALGTGPGLFLVRPDGYLAAIAHGAAAAAHVADHCRRWLTPDQPKVPA